MSSEEVDRKRKELRAQLQRQQEEKQKQGRQGDGGEPAGRRDWGGRGTPAKHGSGKDSPKPGDGASREPGGRRGRHGGGRSPDPGAADHAQQPQPQQQKRPALSTQPAQSGRADRDPRRSGRGSRRAPEDSAPPLRGSGGQQGRRGSESADGKGAGDQPGGGGGGRRGPKRGRGTEPRDWDDGKRPRN
ncbi:hypothetical protein H4R21_006951 [Coemansia helicoidea]|uniref:Uncharacterized protein n=2 Tax=Coemansia TaxID=4863 RepID=A0ACC1KEL3_9FUNG|nr:hypothetical protein H4R21_006951 [Coemansia helicoidea]